MTNESAAEAICVAPSKIKVAVRDGRLAAKYLGKDVLIEHDELVAFVRSLPSARDA